jgi:glycosyltransferase involved in cell wall biosynthesis
MNIVFLLRFWPVYGGGETVTRLLANKFTKLGHHVSVVYLWNTKRPDELFIDSRIREYSVQNISNPIDDNVIQECDYNLIQEELRVCLIEGKTNVIINQWFPAKLVYKASRNLQLKIINCHHTNINLTRPDKWTHRLFQKIFKSHYVKFYLKYRLADFYKYANCCVFLSKYYIDDFIELFNLKKQQEKLCSIPNPLSNEEFLPKKSIAGKENNILFVGRIIEPVKRISYILKTWALLRNDGKTSNWKLIIVGDGPDLENLKEYAGKLCLQNVFFEGFQNPVEYYKKAAILVLSSSQEGWGMVLTEAQQNGCVPVVMDSFSSLHEIIEHGKNGLIVPNNDIQGFAGALETLMFNEAYRRQLAETALETCKKFSVDNIVNQWELLFEEIM